MLHWPSRFQSRYTLLSMLKPTYDTRVIHFYYKLELVSRSKTLYLPLPGERVWWRTEQSKLVFTPEDKWGYLSPPLRGHVQTIFGKINVIVTLKQDPPPPLLTSWILLAINFLILIHYFSTTLHSFPNSVN